MYYRGGVKIGSLVEEKFGGGVEHQFLAEKEAKANQCERYRLKVGDPSSSLV